MSFLGKTISVLVSFFCLGAGAAFAQTDTAIPALVVGGSGANLQITRLLSEAFMEKNLSAHINIPGSIGTKGAIAAVVENALPLGLLSRPLREKEKAPDLVALPYAKTAIVFGAHLTVHDTNISSEDVLNIFSGTKETWSDGTPIIVLTREAGDSGFATIGSLLPTFKDVWEDGLKHKKWAEYFTDQSTNDAIVSTPNALGVTDLGMKATEKLNLKVLSYDGIVPSVETVRDGRYPLTRTLYLLYKKGNLPAELEKFIDFLKTEEARKIMEENNYVPLLE